ncbi:phage holin [Bacillus sp. FMQ74]|uniref:phage holin n=1 Tax=Bacillus sp. FMQ74 TaxID=1913579 RepID=UPI0008FB108F|nr:phage holin [Bacillus sp. FMQ74]OIR59353.1 phage holin [Bacillus sp. FMQ74]
MFENIDKGTIVRTLLLAIALLNQIMMMLGKTAFIINEEDINDLYDCLYTIFTIVFTTSTTTVAWFKNNYVTAKGQKQKQVLKKENLFK